jgi:hypothetical protein
MTLQYQISYKSISGSNAVSNKMAVIRKLKMLDFEVLIALTMKSIIELDMTPCNPVEVHRRFEENTASIFEIEE